MVQSGRVKEGLQADQAVLLLASQGMTRLHSYIVARDYGFAPNPFFGYCTLATCMVYIREGAEVGDWVVGTGSGSKSKQRGGYLVYAMRVEEISTFDEYWSDPRFRAKRPDMYSSEMKSFGDNIYHRNVVDGSWSQADSHHSLGDGSPNVRNIVHDTKVDRVLISRDFVYCGGEGPMIPAFDGIYIHGPRKRYMNRFPKDVVNGFARWVRSLGNTGYCGTPLDWR